MDMQEYLGLFLDESRENLQALNASILDLEREPDEPSEALNTIFRVAHSLKGMSATMGFERMAGLTHRMEEVLSALRDGVAPVTTVVTDVLFACLDTLEGMVNDIGDGGAGAADTSALMDRLSAILSGEAVQVAQVAATVAPPAAEPVAEQVTEPVAEQVTEPVADDAAPAEEGGESSAPELTHYERVVINEAAERGLTVRWVHVRLEDGCMLRAARAYMVVQEVEGLGEIIKSEPSTEDLEREAFDHEFTLWVATEQDEEQLVAAVTGVSEVAEATAGVVEADGETTGDEEAPPAESVQAAPAAVPVAAAPAEAAPAADAAHGGAHPEAGKKPKAAQTVRVGTDRLDSLMNLMGEMVIHRTRLWQLSSDHDLADLRQAVEEMTRVTNDLQSLIMQVRMMPVEAVFMRFPRMVRDLANSLGKQLELIITGEDTELDRTVIDEIGDPLVHILRNAVDHGLEGPEERAAAGKDPVGIVRLTARHEGNSVVIEVSEDGRGIDPNVLRRVVVDKGLMSAEQAAALSDQEAIELIFLPGLSTAKVTTDVSGRGVGMDAVRAKIAGLNGSVEIHSEMGKGSRFIIRLPLTLAIIQALLVKGAGETYALPLEAIEETVVIERTETRPVDGVDCMVLRDNIVPLVSLRARLGLYGDDGESDRHSVVVVRSGTVRLGVLVDELVGQQDIVIKHLPEYLGDVLGIAGATILGDGSVALIIDVGALGDRRGVAA